MTDPRVAGVLLVLGAFSVLAILGPARSASSPEFVSRQGTVLTLGGKPYTFTGLNIYSAYERDLDSALAKIGSAPAVVRVWFFQHMATVSGRRDWAGLDSVLAVARAHGVKVVPVLADQWGSSTDGPVKYLPWWPAPYGGDGYRARLWSSSDLVPYRQWVQQVVSRYKGDPTIAYWQLINEGEARNPDGTDNEMVARGAVHAFAEDIGGLVKSIDPDHLVSLGTVPGEAGSQEADYAYIHRPASIDIADYHDYRFPYSPMGNTDAYNGLAASIDRIHALGKVIVIGESGIHWTSLDTPTLSRRAGLIGQKMSAALHAGVSGYLLWCWNDPATAASDYEIGPNDPSLALLSRTDRSPAGVVDSH